MLSVLDRIDQHGRMEKKHYDLALTPLHGCIRSLQHPNDDSEGGSIPWNETILFWKSTCNLYKEIITQAKGIISPNCV